MSASEDSDVPQPLSRSSSVSGLSSQHDQNAHIWNQRSPPSGAQAQLDHQQSVNEAAADNINVSTNDKAHKKGNQKAATTGWQEYDDEDKAFSAEKSYWIRPNRHYGSSATWRRWTKDERATAEYLDQIRSTDLSVHLFNAFALRKSANVLRPPRMEKGMSAIDILGDELEDIFTPPKVWTAWPMPVAEVPRETITNHVKGRNSQGSVDAPPSACLQDCLLATTMRTARERWESRQWAVQQLARQDGEEFVDHARHSLPQKSCNKPLLSNTDLPMFSAKAFEILDDDGASDNGRKIKDGSDSQKDLYQGSPNARPVSLADDDKARRLLLPSTRHILSGLDDLLVGLHVARQSYANPSYDAGDWEGVTASESESGASRPASKRRGRSRNLRASSTLSNVTIDSEASSSSRRTKNMRAVHTTPHDVQLARLGLRDWSDVLGMANLTGWDKDAVNRASKRCARLFGENMLFRTFHEGENGQPSHFTEALATGDELVQGPFTENEENALEGGELQDLTCPESSCPRHQIPFQTIENLQHHLQQFHPDGIYRVTKKSPHLLQASLQAGGMFCPVKNCPRNSQGFSRGSRLYGHVRNAHPEIDVETLKKLEAGKRASSRANGQGRRDRGIPTLENVRRSKEAQ